MRTHRKQSFEVKTAAGAIGRVDARTAGSKRVARKRGGPGIKERACPGCRKGLGSRRDPGERLVNPRGK